MADQTVVQQVGFAPQVAPYAERLLGKAEALTDTTKNPYMSYAEYAKSRGLDPTQVAGFQDLQVSAMDRARNLGVDPSMYLSGLGLASLAQRASDTGYTPSQFSNQFQAPEQYTPGQFDASRVNAPSLQQFQMGAPERVTGSRVSAPMMRAAQTNFNPQLQQFQMGGPERVGTQSFAQPGSAQAFMSPYMQAVVDAQQREAMRQSGIAGTQLAGQATQSGAFGGARYGLMEAERQRNLATQMGDIQATGLQSAFQQAQQQFNAEQQARLQASLANQQAGLQVGGQNLAAALGVQQLGTQTGLQTALANLSSQQQANVQNQAAQLQAQGLNAQQALQAALANQQATLTTEQQNLAANLGIQQLGAGQQMQAGLANQAAGLQAQQMAEQSRQFGAGQGLQAAGMGAQYGQAAQQLGEQSRQYGAGLGLQGLQAGMGAYGQLAGVGQNIFGQQQQGIQTQQQLGQMQQQQAQAELNVPYQDYLAFQNYPYKQLQFMSDVTRGTPTSVLGSSMYQAAPSMFSQIAGAGTALLGANTLSGNKLLGLGGAEGGLPRDFKKAPPPKKNKAPMGLQALALSQM